MCGVVGYIGTKNSLPILIEGLKKLEYRGYDSAGISVIQNKKIVTCKKKGKIKDLEKELTKRTLKGTIGIGHTRWATHGKPSTVNSHPHLDSKENISLIHNGIIENFSSLRQKLEDEGIVFKSETDTEVLTQLIGYYYTDSLEEAVRTAIKEVEGAFAICVIAKNEPDKIVVAKQASPLCIGIGKNESFIGSDVMAFISHTNKTIYLQDGEIGVITKDKQKITDFEGKSIKKKVVELSLNSEDIEKGEYKHFMLKEIYEQPAAIQNTLEGRISPLNDKVLFPDLKITSDELLKINRVVVVACGTSLNAGMVGEYFIEKYAKIPVETEYAAEFRYRNPIIDSKTLVIAISQSGETADTLAAIGEAQSKGAKVLSIVNVPESSIARDSAGVIYTKAGPEIGVASTKAFTTQLVVLLLFAIYFGNIRRTLSREKCIELLSTIRSLPVNISRTFQEVDKIKKLAKKYKNRTNALYLGRGVGFPIALEGALKLKEISYIHAEGYSAAEMKHGPIALIDENMPTIVLAFRGRRYEKILGNIMEIKSRGGDIIAIASEDNDDIGKRLKHVIYIPTAKESLSSVLAVIPLQLFAYYLAAYKGCEVDQPRNLAKSVTVE